MHPILAHARRLLAWDLACVALGAGVAALLYAGGHADAVGALAFALPLALVAGFVALSAYWVCRSLPPARRDARAVALRYGPSSLAAGAVLLGLALAWNPVGELREGGRPFVTMPAEAWALLAAGGAGLYLLSLLAHDVLVAFESVREAARREAESRGQARDAELRLLRAQVDPHFLFNSLHSISALTAFDPEEARAMTIDLAAFFRATLALGERDHIPLGEELALCRHFLAIEQRRLGPRLRTSLTATPEAEACLLPPLLLQPLVENALKHGLRHVPGGGTVEVDARVRDGWLQVAVANPVADDGPGPGPGEAVAPASPGAPATEGAAGLGLGLATLRARLRLLHGDRARVEARHAPGRFAIEITLPARGAS